MTKSSRRKKRLRFSRIAKPFTTMMVVFGLIAGAEMSAAIATEFLAAQERELSQLLNQERVARGLDALPTADALRTVSRRHTQAMMLEGRIFHADDLRGEVESVFPDWAKIGENVGVGPDIPRTHQAFMDSPGHRANILDPAWQTMGIGVVAGGGRLYMTQRFLRLRTGSTVPPDALATEGSGQTAQTAPESGGDTEVQRLRGSGRVETAAALVDFAFPPGSADGAVLADAFDFHGALAGSALAGALDGPVVLSGTDALDPAAADALLSALGRESGAPVHVIGNFSPGVASAIRALGLTVIEHRGADFAAEAATVARALPARPSTAIVARVDTYPDALAASAVAAQAGWPILFTDTNSLSPATASAIRDLGISQVHIVGGTGAVSQGVQNAIAALGASVSRHSGPSRVDTSLAIADLALQQGLAGATVQLATARAFPDALAGGALAPRLGAPVILTEPGALSAETASWLRARSNLDRVLLLGGTGALGVQVEVDVKAL